MRTCEEYEALISAFIDGALDDGSRAELMAHMADCPACQAYFDDQIAIHDALGSMEAQAPADLTARVMEQVRREPRQSPNPAAPEKKVVAFPYWRRFAALAACCAVVALAGFWAFGGGQFTAGNVAADTATQRAFLPEDEENQASQADGSVSPAADDVVDDGTAPSDSGVTSSQPQENGATGSDDPTLPQGDDSGSTLLPPPVNQEVVPPTGDEGAIAGKDAMDSPTMYASAGNTVTLTTDSQMAVDWVAENLGQTWEAGASYTLTAEQFAQVKALLAENGESFTEVIPDTKGQAQDSLPAGDETGGSTGEQVTVTYVLHAAP